MKGNKKPMKTFAEMRFLQHANERKVFETLLQNKFFPGLLK